jgi:hypothetical protein
MSNLLKAPKQFLEDKLGIQIRSKVFLTIPNEAINVQTKVVFVAVPKSGSTSVRTQTKDKRKSKTLLYHPHLDIMQLRELFYVYSLRKFMRKNTSFPTENMLTDQQIRLESAKTFDSYFKFAGVRNPWARAVSLYSRREDVRMKEQISFEAFVESHHYASDTCKNCTLHKNQYDWLCDHEGNNQMDFIYKVEELGEAIPKIREMTDGRVSLQEVNRNKNPKSRSRNYRDLYNDRTKNIIATRFEKDIDLFKYTF